MRPPTPSNTRYKLELETNALLQEKYEFDEKYGTFTFAFLTSLEAFALLAYLYVATVLIYYKQTRTKTNFIVSVWAIINFAVLLEKLSRAFGVVIGEDFLITEDALVLSEMVSALGRCYGTLLAFVWLFSKYFGTPKPKYNIFMYILISIPTIVCCYYVYYYFNINKFISEVYGPGCDVVNSAVYLFVGFTFILCRIFQSNSTDTSPYPLMISLVNLVTSLPICLITIYLRFNLNKIWEYRFRIYFVDFFVQGLTCSSAFAALFILMLYNNKVKQNFFAKKSYVVDSNDKEEQVKIRSEYHV